jgi:hypothetical protein
MKLGRQEDFFPRKKGLFPVRLPGLLAAGPSLAQLGCVVCKTFFHTLSASPQLT